MSFVLTRVIRAGTLVAAAASAIVGLAACSGTGSPSAAATADGHVPRPAHTIVVVMENHSYDQVIGSKDAPFINSLARRGALFTNSHAISHPSQPNYLALFSGSTHGVQSDSCPYEFSGPNLAHDLLAKHETFAGYAETMPSVGYTFCVMGNYARKHVPWADFTNVPGSVSLPFTDFPASDLAKLPDVSWVIPNLCNDMHNCSTATGDTWLREHLSGYVNWAMTHNSLLILTFDENDGSPGNQIPTIFVGQNVKPGRYGLRINDYNVLATIEAAYGLPRDGQAAKAAPITGVWRRG
jgi:phosphatidylinositol-3-phosphatase